MLHITSCMLLVVSCMGLYMQHVAHNKLHATCCIVYGRLYMQHVAHNKLHATCCIVYGRLYMQHVAHNKLHATCCIVYGALHATCSCNKLHATCCIVYGALHATCCTSQVACYLLYHVWGAKCAHRIMQKQQSICNMGVGVQYGNHTVSSFQSTSMQ